MAGPQEPPPGAVDARFTLAAERTVLAWVRTALGMVAAGIAVMHVIPGFSSAGVRDVMGMALIIVGALSAVIGGWRWRHTTTALETGGPLPGPAPVWLIIGVLVALSMVVLIASVVD